MQNFQLSEGLCRESAMHMRGTITLNRHHLFTHVDPGRVDHRGRAARVIQEIGTQGGMYDLRGGDYCALT